MKHIRNKNGAVVGHFGRLAQNIENYFRVNPVGSRPTAAKAAISLESVSEQELAEVEGAVAESARDLTEEVQNVEIPEELTEGQQDAGIILMTAAGGDIEEYRQAATAKVDDSDAVLSVNHVDTAVSTESYDMREIERTLGVSVAFNVGAARQQAAMEMFFPTISLTADNAGLTLDVARIMVHHEYKHDTKGAAAPSQFGQKNLIDALIDSNILQNQVTEIVPVYDASVGVFDTDFGPMPYKVDDTIVDAGAILFGTAANIIAADRSSTTDPFNLRDQTDSVDSYVTLRQVNLEITDNAGTKSIIPLDVRNLSTNGFLKSLEGHDRNTTLSWTTDTFPIHGQLKDKTGVPAAALAQLNTAPYDQYVLHLKMGAHGNLNLADGNIELTANSVSIAAVYKTIVGSLGETQLERITDAAELAAIKNMFKEMKLTSYFLDARYPNLNRRERGLILRSDMRRKKYMVPMQAPMTVLKPMTDTLSGYNIDAAVQSARVANTVAAVKELMTIDDLLSRYRTSNDRKDPVADINSIGIFSLRPYYERRTFDFLEVVNNVQSHTLSDDLSSALTLNLRDSFARAMLVSGWNAAQECIGGGAKERPTAILVTDPRVEQFLVVKGDNRLFGDAYKARVETSDYLEFRNRIYMTVRREASVQTPDGLSFGNMFWLPELITNLPIARSGQISNEFSIQTRRLHVVHCPILIRYDLVNLDKVLDTKVSMHVVQ